MSKEEIDMLQADHDQVGQDLYDTKQRLLDQLDANHVLTELKYTGNTGLKMMDQAIFSNLFMMMAVSRREIPWLYETRSGGLLYKTNKPS